MSEVEIKDGEIVRIDGRVVERVIPLGQGTQHSVLLVMTTDKAYLVECGSSSKGQYVEVLTEMNELKQFAIIRFYDNDGNEFFDVAQTDLSEEELQKVTREVIEEFDREDFLDWSYEDLVERLNEREAIKSLGFVRYYEIYA